MSTILFLVLTGWARFITVCELDMTPRYAGDIPRMECGPGVEAAWVSLGLANP